MQIGSDILLEILRRHVVSAIFLLLTVSTISVLLVVRWWLKRRWRQLLEEKFEEEEELDTLMPIGPQDQQTLDLIRQLRQEVWEMPETDLQLNIEALTQRATRIVRSIAALYHPEVEIPQYEASLVEILHLIRRTSSRLARMGSVVPFRFLGNRKLSDYQRYYQVYRKINENRILQLFKRNPHIYKVARWAMDIKNLGNPLYWAGRELSREGYFYVLRWFYLTFINQVGREAMRLYSGRHFQRDEDRDATLVAYRLYALTRQWGGPTSVEWAILVDHVANHGTLEADVKIHLLSRFAQDRIPENLDGQNTRTRSGIKWYQQGLKALLEKDGSSMPLKEALIRQELEALERTPPQGPQEEAPVVDIEAEFEK